VKRIAVPASPGLRPQLEVRDLELVLALSVAGSTAAAASALHLTQSAVSRALGQAEERLGVPLFERSARGLSVTAAGQRLVSGAPSLIRQLAELEQLVVAPTPVPLRVRLVCECYTAYRWLPSALSSLQERWPELSLDIVAEHTGDPVAALRQGEIDVALLTTSPLPEGVGLSEQQLFSDEVVFVMASGHPLARQRRLTPLQLQGETLITGNTPPAEARWFTRAAFGRRRPKLRFLRFPLTEAIMDAARAGMGIAVLSEWVASGYFERGDLVARRLVSGALMRTWRIAYRDDVSSVAERLKGALLGMAPRLR
jgi:LysR family transcriptional regulator, regulator for metE and metH